MGNSKKRKKKKKVGYNSLGMIAIALVVLVLLGGLMLESNDLKERLTGYDAKAATLQQQIEDEQTRTEEIDKLKKYLHSFILFSLFLGYPASLIFCSIILYNSSIYLSSPNIYCFSMITGMLTKCNKKDIC